jgi:hypothetical protein
MRRTVAFAVLAAGWLSVSAGFGWLHPAAGLVTAGAGLVWFALVVIQVEGTGK